MCHRFPSNLLLQSCEGVPVLVLIKHVSKRLVTPWKQGPSDLSYYYGNCYTQTSVMFLTFKEYTEALETLNASLTDMQVNYPDIYSQFWYFVLSGKTCVSTAKRTVSGLRDAVKLANIARTSG